MESQTDVTVYVTDPNNSSQDPVQLVAGRFGHITGGTAQLLSPAITDPLDDPLGINTVFIHSVGGHYSGILNLRFLSQDDNRFSFRVLNNTFPLEVSVFMDKTIQTVADLGVKRAELEVRAGNVSLIIRLFGDVIAESPPITSYDSDGHPIGGNYYHPRKPDNVWLQLLVMFCWLVIAIVTSPITVPLAALWYFILNPIFKILRWLWRL